LQREEPFDPVRTLFVDDSVAVLRSARQYGIAELLAILKPDTRQAGRKVDEFPAVQGFSALVPGLHQYLSGHAAGV
jgi:putative hydrolase of the HAD superfamily